MLSDADAAAMEEWALSAQAWSEASQALVAAAGSFELASRTLSERLDTGEGALGPGEKGDRARLVIELSMLADAVEAETRVFRDAYLQTAARIRSYDGLLD